MQVTLVGTFHPYQKLGIEKYNWKGFRNYLNKIVIENQFDLLAEELNQQSIQNDKGMGAYGSVLRKIAMDNHLLHIFADPDGNERNTLNIEHGEDDKREVEWLKRILESKAKQILFICGARHIDSFKEKLEKQGIAIEIKCQKWFDKNDSAFEEIK